MSALAFLQDITIPRVIGAAVLLYSLTFLDQAYKTDGRLWPAFQHLPFWELVRKALRGSVEAEAELDHNQQYIFACFPHGAYTLSHILTMTNCCGMLSKIYRGSRRDLAASVLFFIPGLRELCLWAGCVDAGAATAHHNLKKGRSIFIFIGGEEEQLLTQKGRHIVVIRNRKGFIKLALQYGAHLVPMYAFGETDAYHTSNFLIGFRKWLQKSFRIALPLVFGKYFSCFPLEGSAINVVVGKPIVVSAVKDSTTITPAQIDALHQQFIDALTATFDGNKAKYGYEKAVLELV